MDLSKVIINERSTSFKDRFSETMRRAVKAQHVSHIHFLPVITKSILLFRFCVCNQIWIMMPLLAMHQPILLEYDANISYNFTLIAPIKHKTLIIQFDNICFIHSLMENL